MKGFIEVSVDGGAKSDIRLIGTAAICSVRPTGTRLAKTEIRLADTDRFVVGLSYEDVVALIAKSK